MGNYEYTPHPRISGWGGCPLHLSWWLVSNQLSHKVLLVDEVELLELELLELDELGLVGFQPTCPFAKVG